jgi:hypothetical protein
VRAFRREGDDLVAEVDVGEREVLATVVADVAELLGGGRLEDRAARGTGDGPDDDDDRAAAVTATVRLRLDPLPVPDDPAVLRLLPDASRDDREVAAEFRRLTEGDLRQQKIDRLADLFDALGEGGAGAPATIRVPKARAAALAATLTDVRLVLGERLGVTDEEASARLEDDVVAADPAPGDHAAQARQYLGSVFLALGWWQETLMACLLADLPHRPERPHRPEHPGRPAGEDGPRQD